MSKVLPSDLYLSSLENQNKTKSSQLGKDDFMKLLMAQLANQDPLNPMEDREFISQMATFSSLEQMMNISQTITNLYSSQQLGNQLQYSELIGKEITWTETVEDETNEEIVKNESAKVVAIHYKDKETKVEVEGGKLIEIPSIIQISRMTEQEQDV